MAVLSRGSLFQPQLVTDLINKVQGESSLAKMTGQTPIPFNGQKEFVFTMDSEVDVVAENGAKSHGGIALTPRTILPIKVEYGARVSDEFMFASEEETIEILRAFNEGFARKVARGLDLMAMHGVNPRTGLASTVIGNNHFDAAVTNEVEFVPADVDENIEAAIALVDGNVTGMIMSSDVSAALSALRTADTTNARLYPELAWGANPGTINGLRVDISRNVSDMSDDVAILGDFAGSFRWGYAKSIPVEIIPYGDPDNSGVDLKGHNQVYIRAELYLGWAVLEADNFARIVEAEEVEG